MAIKIVGIIVIGLAFIGSLAFALIYFDRKWKQQQEDRKQRLVEKDHNDNFTLSLFNLILEDDQLRAEQLITANAQKDETIEKLNKKIKKMQDIASKCNLPDLYQSLEEDE